MVLIPLALVGCATTRVPDENAPTAADKAVVKLLNSKRPGKQVKAALKAIKPYAEPRGEQLVETIKDADGSLHRETELRYPELGIKVFFYDGKFSGADTIPDHEQVPGL